MKPVKNFVFAALLVSSLAFNSFAGDIDVPGIIPPPPRMSATNDDSTTLVGSETQQTDLIQAETSDYLFFEALAALLSVY
jgi:hypothetical protein